MGFGCKRTSRPRASIDAVFALVHPTTPFEAFSPSVCSPRALGTTLRQPLRAGFDNRADLELLGFVPNQFTLGANPGFCHGTAPYPGAAEISLYVVTIASAARNRLAGHTNVAPISGTTFSRAEAQHVSA